VNVRCTALDGVEQDFVDESNDRRIFDIVTAIILHFFLTTDIEIFEIKVVVVEPRHAGVNRLDRSRDAFLKFVLFNNDRFNAKAGRELDVVDCLQIGWIRDTKENFLAALHQRQDTVFANEFLVNGPNDVKIDVNGIEIEKWYAELM